VVTSTDLAFRALSGAVPVDVSVFTRPESLGYLAARTGMIDDPAADAVADKLGDLPLALAQAAATITGVVGGPRLTYSKYLELLARVPVDKLLGRAAGEDYPRPTSAALLLSVQAVEDADPAGLTSLVLRVVAALSPDGVRRDLLDGLRAARSGGSDEDIDAAVERCAAESLLTWSVAGDAVIMHRLLGRVLRERDQAAGQWADTVNAVLGLLEPLMFPEDQAWSRRAEGAELVTQIDALWESDADAGSADRDLAAGVLAARSWAVRQLGGAADLGRAIDAGVRTLADSERVLGVDDPHTRASRYRLASAYESAGRLSEAIPLFEQTLADCERVLGPEHPDTLLSRSNLAAAYSSAGRLSEAIPLFEQTLANREQVDDEDTRSLRNNLAAAYHWVGRLGEAIRLYEQNVAVQERVLGPEHPDTLLSRNNLASGYVSAGRPREAIRLHEQNIADSARLLGPDARQTLVWRSNLAYAYLSARRPFKAVWLYGQILDDSERLLGPDDHETLQARSSLAYAYLFGHWTRRLAIHLYEQNVADSERFFGPDDRRTLASRRNLAVAYLWARRHSEAIQLLKQTLADCERVLGPDDPDTLRWREDLEQARMRTGRR